jgi:hypothetical protein
MSLNLASGGLIKSGNFAVNIGAAVESGKLDGQAAPDPLCPYTRLTIKARSPSTPASLTTPWEAVPCDRWRLVLPGCRRLASANNSYCRGGTVVDGITLTLAATGYLPSGGLTLNGGNFTQIAGGTIAATNAVTLNGNSTLTIAGTTTISSLTINNIGSTTAASVISGTLTVSNGLPPPARTSAPRRVSPASWTSAV